MSDEVERITRQVITKLHTNAYEHRNVWSFYKSCLISGFLGLLIGGVIEETMKFVEDKTSLKPTSRLYCGGLLWLQLSLIALALYIGNKAPFVRKVLYFDDWLMGTFAGFLFALTFINVQNRLNTSTLCFAFGQLPNGFEPLSY